MKSWLIINQVFNLYWSFKITFKVALFWKWICHSKLIEAIYSPFSIDLLGNTIRFTKSIWQKRASLRVFWWTLIAFRSHSDKRVVYTGLNKTFNLKFVTSPFWNCFRSPQEWENLTLLLFLITWTILTLKWNIIILAFSLNEHFSPLKKWNLI